MILVTGATGTVGRELVQRLTAAALPFRALTRDPVQARAILGPGVTLVAGNLARPETLELALAGADHAYLASAQTPGQVEREVAFAHAAARAGVRHIVKLSGLHSAGPDAPFRLHGDIERAIEETGLTYTHLRPDNFMQSLPLLVGRSVATTGTIALPMGAGRLAWVDVRDVADVAFRALTEGGHAGRVYELTGPEALSFTSVAGALAVALGREVRYVDLPPEALRQRMEGEGWPAEAVAGFLAFCAYVRGGHEARVTDDVPHLTGHPARPFAAFAAEVAPVFAGATSAAGVSGVSDASTSAR